MQIHTPRNAQEASSGKYEANLTPKVGLVGTNKAVSAVAGSCSQCQLERKTNCAYFIKYGINRLRPNPNTFWTTKPSPIVRDLSRGDAISEYNVYVIGPTALSSQD